MTAERLQRKRCVGEEQMGDNEKRVRDTAKTAGLTKADDKGKTVRENKGEGEK